MVDPTPFCSLVSEETARLKCFEAFMCGRYLILFIIPTESVIRVELEQQMYAGGNIVHEPGTDCPERISGIQVLLEGAPPLPGRKLLWH